MTQPLEDNRLYSTWSRTPGKPNSSSNFINTKISNISSSTDSGVGRTPNWNSDSENKFRIYDSNLWSNPLPATDITDNPKKLSWDENTSKLGNNFTFGFSSQWPTNADISPWGGLSRNSSSDFIVNDSTKLDNCWNNNNNNNSSSSNSQSLVDPSTDRFLTRNNSIWATNQPDSNNSITTTANIDNNNTINCFHIVDSVSKSSKNNNNNNNINNNTNNKSILPPESDKSEFPLFSAFNSSVVNDIGALEELGGPEMAGGSGDKGNEHQTWAQAAGKGLQVAVKDDGGGGGGCGVKHEVDEHFLSLINRVDGWGSHTVDQSTPWVVDSGSDLFVDAGDKLGSLQAQRTRSNVESNVWTNEPPNGVGVWESHYENLGERTSRWGAAVGVVGVGVGVGVGVVGGGGGGHPKVKPSASSGWEIGSIVDSGVAMGPIQWTDRDDSSVWSVAATGPGSVAAVQKQQQQQQQQPLPPPSSWGILGNAIGKQQQQQQEQAATTPIGSGSSRICTSSNLVPTQRNTNATVSSVISGSGPVDGNESANRHSGNSFYQNQNVNMMPSSRMALNTKSKQMVNVGFRKDDPQTGLFNNPMEMNRPFMDMKNPSLSHASMMGSRNDWNMGPHDNFRVNAMEPDNGVILGSGYMPQSMMAPNNQPLKPPHMMQQHMQQQQHQHQQHQQQQQQQQQQMSMGGRLASDNHLLLEKQIIGEITQLQSKQQDLMHRIQGLRSIAGSQAFIQEMTRTLNEVRQQLNTQQTTLKVIRSQMSMVNSNPMPNGMMNSNSSNALMSMVSRTIQPSAPGVPSQSQSGPLSDLSVQMHELKLQKSRMELWSQGTLPSPSTISPYMGVADKPGGFYNPSIPNGGPMPPQSFSSFNRNSQINCISTHRQPGQMWQQSRMLQNSNCAAPSSSAANAFGSGGGGGNVDQHAMSNGPSANINDEMDLLTGSNSSVGNSNSAGNGNSSHSAKLQITSNQCASDATGNNNSNNNSTANSAITTALSLSQTLPSSIGSRVSSAFSSSRDISHISASISEFVPGQPWPGISYSQRDDPNVTLGTGPRSLLSITNDHLEKLANSSVNSLNGPNDVGGNNSSNCNSGNINNIIINNNNNSISHNSHNSNNCSSGNNNNNTSSVNRLANNLNGVCSNRPPNMTYVLIRDLPSHINIEMLKNVLTPHSFPGLIHMHPNLAARWVLLHFTTNEEALKAYKNLYNKVGIVELLPDQEVNQVTRGHRNNGIIEQPMF